MRQLIVPFALAVLLAACAPSTPPAGPSPASPHDPSPSERAEILGVVQLVFDALETGNGDLMRQAIVPGAPMNFGVISAEGATSIGATTADAMANMVENAAAPLIERMWDAEVRVTGPLAVAWTPYDFYTETGFSHCGVNAVTLMRSDEGWRIVSIAWVQQQPPACALHPDGPPGG